MIDLGIMFLITVSLAYIFSKENLLSGFLVAIWYTILAIATCLIGVFMSTHANEFGLYVEQLLTNTFNL